jgi:hypothetical protein
MPRPKGEIYQDPETKERVVPMAPGDVQKRNRTAAVPRRRANQMRKIGMKLGTFGSIVPRGGQHG